MSGRVDRAALIALRGVAARGLATLLPHAHFPGTPAPGRHAALVRAFGRGLAYAESRPYQHGDDVRSIDWRVTARQGKPFTKVFERERERPLWLVVDLPASMRFGSRCQFKSELAARAATWLAWSGRAGGDRVGGAVRTEHSASLLSPKRGDAGVLALVEALAGALAGAARGPAGLGPAQATDTPSLAGVLEEVRRVVRAGDRVCVLGDFYCSDDPAEGARLFSALGALAARAEILLFPVADPLEAAPPPAGEYPVLASGGTRWLDLSDTELRAAWALPHQLRRNRLAEAARRQGWPLFALWTDDALLDGLVPLARPGGRR